MFTMNIDLWCFSFVTLFNLQGTRPSASAAEHVLSYHVVRLLSSTFFNFFEVFSALAAAFRRSLRQLIYFTRTARVCQALFSLRWKFFRSRRWHDRRVSDSLLTIPDLSSVVNTFLQKSFISSVSSSPSLFILSHPLAYTGTPFLIELKSHGFSHFSVFTLAIFPIYFYYNIVYPISDILSKEGPMCFSGR